MNRRTRPSASPSTPTRLNPHLCALAVALCAVATPAWASLDLAKKNACMGCHAVDRKMVGPAFAEVAKRYAGKSADELAKSIKAGGAGKWGATPMTAQGQLSDADAKTLAAWVLAGAK